LPQNSLLTKIVQLDPMQIKFEIFDKEAKVFISLSDDSLCPYDDQLTLFYPLIDPKTGTFSLQVYFPNPNNLSKWVNLCAFIRNGGKSWTLFW
jgi:hypothetical protein